MAGILDQLEQRAARAARDEGDAIAGAAHRATWANQFNSIPPVEKLRENLNLAVMVDTALRRKQELLAKGDLKAQELLHREKKFEQWEQDAPLRTELLIRRVESEGAHERFVQRKDAEAMQDVSGFFDTVSKIVARPGTPEYQSGLNAAIQKHPRIIGTQAGADALKNLQREHTDIASITPPAGMEVDRIDIGEDGKAKAVFKPIPAPSAVALPEGLVPVGATQNKRGDVSVNYAAPKAEKDTILPSLEKERALYARELSKARERRKKADGNKGLEVDADTDTADYQQKLTEVESQIRSHREGAPAQPAAAPAATASERIATNPTTGEKLAFRNGAWVPLKP